MVRTQVQLREDQVQALKRLAATRGVSVAELIRQSVDAFIRASKSVDKDEQRRRAIAAAGRFRSGTSDTSSEHDRYLVEAFQR